MVEEVVEFGLSASFFLGRGDAQGGDHHATIGGAVLHPALADEKVFG